MAGSNDLITNPTFMCGSDQGWEPLCCSLSISDKTPQCGGPPSGHQFYCNAHNRTQAWQGIAQDITDRLKAGVEYKVEVCVAIAGPVELADVRTTLKLENAGGQVNYITLASGPVSNREWALLKGKMELSTLPNKALVYLEGPPAGVDMLASSFSIAPLRPEPECSSNGSEEKEDLEGSILVNPSFDSGVQGWSGFCCKILHSASHGWKGVSGPKGTSFAIALDRTEGWQGIQQDITDLVEPNETYIVRAVVRTAGQPHEGANVLASVRLENAGSNTRYITVGSAKASSTEWITLEGKLHLEARPQKAVFYMEGPPSGVEILVASVTIKPVDSVHSQGPAAKRQGATGFGFKDLKSKTVDIFKSFKEKMPKARLISNSNVAERNPAPQLGQAGSIQSSDFGSILQNATFTQGLQSWAPKGCKGFVCECLENPKILPFEGKSFAVASHRTDTWSGIEQIISDRIELEALYNVAAVVRICGACPRADVRATLYIQEVDNSERYITMGSVEATKNEWKRLEGRLILLKPPKKVSVYLEGPPPGTDLLVDSFSICPASKPEPAEPPVFTDVKFGVNIVENANLLHGTNHWFGQGSARISIASGAPTFLPPAAVLSLPYPPPQSSGNYIIASNRTQWWEGPAQTITDKLELNVPYQVSAWVRVGKRHGQIGPQKVNVALSFDGKWITGGEVEADANSWKETVGSFRLEKKPKYAMVYVQGAEPGVDLMIAGLQIFAVDRGARVATLRAQTDKIRKRDVVLQFSTRDKQPVPPGVRVRIEQTSRSFPLGSCINRRNLDNSSYKQFFLDNFNWAVFENEIKWGWTEPQRDTFNYKDADEMMGFCVQNSIPMRGHCIFWEDEHWNQEWLKTLNPQELGEAVQNRAVDLLNRYKGIFRHYDVNNEMLHGSFFRDRLQPDILPYMFKLAHQLDSEAILFVNDYHVEDGEDGNSSPEKYLEQIQWLLNQGAPVGGIGVQGHVDTPIGSIICSALDKLATLRLPIWMTEIDVAAANEHTRADDLEVMLRESFAHPGVEGIMLWGFWEGALSREYGHLVDSDKRVNAAGKRLIALREEWTTSLHGGTEDDGQFSYRGYLGGYTAYVNFGQGEVPLEFEVTKGSDPQVIELFL